MKLMEKTMKKLTLLLLSTTLYACNGSEHSEPTNFTPNSGNQADLLSPQDIPFDPIVSIDYLDGLWTFNKRLSYDSFPVDFPKTVDFTNRFTQIADANGRLTLDSCQSDALDLFFDTKNTASTSYNELVILDNGDEILVDYDIFYTFHDNGTASATLYLDSGSFQQEYELTGEKVSDLQQGTHGNFTTFIDDIEEQIDYQTCASHTVSTLSNSATIEVYEDFSVENNRITLSMLDAEPISTGIYDVGAMVNDGSIITFDIDTEFFGRSHIVSGSLEVLLSTPYGFSARLFDGHTASGQVVSASIDIKYLDYTRL